MPAVQDCYKNSVTQFAFWSTGLIAISLFVHQYRWVTIYSGPTFFDVSVKKLAQ